MFGGLAVVLAEMFSQDARVFDPATQTGLRFCTFQARKCPKQASSQVLTIRGMLGFV